jgi:hypothetical protein
MVKTALQGQGDRHRLVRLDRNITWHGRSQSPDGAPILFEIVWYTGMAFCSEEVSVRRALILVVLGIVGVMLAGCGQGGTGVLKDVQSVKPKVPSKQEHGAKDAKVHIVSFYPVDDRHKDIPPFLFSLADRYPGKVNVTAWDFSTPEGAEAVKKAFGEFRGGMQINGQTEFKVMVKGKQRDVTLMYNEFTGWEKPEVAAALDQVVQKVYQGSGAGGQGSGK